MTSMEHVVKPEDVMALVDGELSGTEAQRVEEHLAECTECAAVAADFRETAQAMATWKVEAMSEGLDAVIRSAAVREAGVRRKRTGGVVWFPWGLGGGAVAMASVLLLVGLQKKHGESMARVTEPASMSRALQEGDSQHILRESESQAAPRPPAPSALAASSDATAPAKMPAPQFKRERVMAGGGRSAAEMVQPMIARNVSLQITVRDAEVARREMDESLQRRNGYYAELHVDSPEGKGREVRASLRIPAAELAAAVAELRRLGRVTVESSSGEEVSSQHADLVARLKTARESEDRFRAILQTRTGSVSDVLEVEEEIARVRGEIEGMEAEQLALEHRVEFAAVIVELQEEYKGQSGTPTAVGTRLQNAFVAGYRGAGETILGIVLFLEEEGPSLLVWLGLMGVAGMLILRRYKKMRDKI